ncbi:hypothetical protein DPMN_137231 [Dreissena polymorpha]|uniref:Uncharacterized protein n=1 Tax=Dreissena polymorpha TaxID=45954 RepID=A0A9D4G2D7_DREPO|nr:hypothetical protein DPMN_137231 [Dreissena polymorpha]
MPYFYSVHFQNYVEDVSVEVCNIMSRLGYGEEIRWRRVEKVRVNDMLFTARAKNIHSNIKTVITAGSKAEGLACLLESDLDRLFVHNSACGVEAVVDLHTIPDDIEVFRMDTRAYPGHCKLLLEGLSGTCSTEIYNALCLGGKGNALLSSQLFLDEEAKPKSWVISSGTRGAFTTDVRMRWNNY